MKNTEKMTKQNEIEPFFNQLLARQMFPCGQNTETIGECLSRASLAEAKKKIEEIKTNLSTRASDIINKVGQRAKSYNFETRLDHIGLWGVFRLKNLRNNFRRASNNYEKIQMQSLMNFGL